MRSFIHALAVLQLVALVATPALARNVWEKRAAHGAAMMTKAEKKTYWREFLALETDAERQAYWDAHVAKMEARALERGVALPDPPKVLTEEERNLGFWRPPYFPEIMTEEELASYRPDLDAIPDREARRRYVADHIRRMQARAEARGVAAPSADEFKDVFDEPEVGAAAEAGDVDPAEDAGDELEGDGDLDVGEELGAGDQSDGLEDGPR